ncbi:MAG: hypothetical protein ABIN58_04385, partial [candidate division WOR-3 bacterium]
WELGSWDGFMLPRPFSRCVVYLEEETDRSISRNEAGKRLSAASEKAISLLRGGAPELLARGVEIREQRPL